MATTALFSVDVDQTAVFYMVDVDHCLFLLVNVDHPALFYLVSSTLVNAVNAVDVHFTACEGFFLGTY